MLKMIAKSWIRHFKRKRNKSVTSEKKSGRSLKVWEIV